MSKGYKSNSRLVRNHSLSTKSVSPTAQHNYHRSWLLLLAGAALLIALAFPGSITSVQSIVQSVISNSHMTTTESKKPTQVKTVESGVSELENIDQPNLDELPEEVRSYRPRYQKIINPTKKFIDGRRIAPIELIPQKKTNKSHTVKVYLLDDFLSEEECDGLRAVHDKHVNDLSEQAPLMCFEDIDTMRKHLKQVHRSDTELGKKDFVEGTRCLNSSMSEQVADWIHHNWSYSTAFYPGESKFSMKMEAMIEEVTGMAKSNGGKFQITSYPLNVGYKSHTDCTENTSEKRDRMGTILVYLDTVAEGGETEFSELGIWVKPRKGRAIVWNNMDEEGHCEAMSIHHARKVISGHKYILQRWYYYESFFSLGKRQPPPPLPPRSPDQAMVACDEYEHGSCRWYDEWNYDNIDDYRRQKMNLI